MPRISRGHSTVPGGWEALGVIDDGPPFRGHKKNISIGFLGQISVASLCGMSIICLFACDPCYFAWEFIHVLT